MMIEDTATVHDMQDLKALCAAIANGELFSTHHPDEQQTVATIMPTMCERSGYAFPLTIVHQDKPDFLLHFSDHSVGLEVTRFFAPALAHATATANRLHMPFTPTRFGFDSPKRSKYQMELAIAASPVGLTDWNPIFDQRNVDQVLAIIEGKKQKILSGGPAIADEHWLLIDERHRMCEIQLDFVVNQSFRHLVAHWSKARHFSRVLILSGSVLVDLNSVNLDWRNIG